MSANFRNTLKLIVGTLGFLGLLIAAQAILAHYNRRLDLTPQKKFTLSPRTQQVVTGLKKDVQALAFIHSDRPENFFFEDLLSRMAALSPHFSYHIVDINRNPALARQYQAVHYGTLVFESDGQRRGTLLSTGENGVLTTLLQITRGREKVVYFLTGQGEGDVTNATPQEGYTKLRGALGDEFYQVKTLSLAEQGGAVPEDAAVLVLVGPKAKFLPSELSALDAYIQRGGALLVLFDVNGSPSLIPFLENYGVRLPPLVAVDPAKCLYAGEMITFRASSTARPHPILISVNAPPIFSLTRVIEVREDPIKGIIARPILATSGEGWATAEQNITKAGTATFVEGRDSPGPIPIAGEVAVRTGEKLGRIVVFGDADLGNNSLLELGGNKDFFVNAVNWLAEDIEQIGARPEMQRSGVNQLFLSAEQGRMVLLLGTVAMPGAFLLVGVSVFLWRRQRG
jgi:gliding motility-associatede transport system auxiliary component